MWLVEPPVASSATQALTIAFSSTRWPTGVGSPPACGDRDRALAGRAVERRPQRGAGVGERRVGQVQAHHLHQHLVAVGGAVERAGALRVVGRRLGLEQLLAADLALGVELAHPRLLAVRQAGGHRAGGHEDGGQVAEGQRADEQPRHDLVADAEHHRGVEHVVRERDRGRHRDQVATEERELHAGPALGDAVAHGGHAAGELREAAGPDDRLLQHLRDVPERLVGREHVVVRRHDGHVGLAARAQAGLEPAPRRRRSRGRGWRRPACRGPGPCRRRRRCGRGRRCGSRCCGGRCASVTSATTGWTVPGAWVLIRSPARIGRRARGA